MTPEQKSALAGVVTVDMDVMHGTPCFADTRVPVQTLIDFLETGETIDDFLAVYPAILRQQACTTAYPGGQAGEATPQTKGPVVT